MNGLVVNSRITVPERELEELSFAAPVLAGRM
jgi:hypothetical protein